MSCTAKLWVDNSNSTDAFEGILGVNYLHVYECGPVASIPFVVLLYMLLVVGVCFYLLGSTADSYFSPTLANLCDEIGVSHEVAGVTFLALGNGSPDVFSSLAAFANDGGDAQLGLGALLGAAAFVLNVVLGSVILVGEIEVAPGAIIRDITFFIFVVGLIIGWGSSGRTTTLGASMAFISIYFMYIAVVFAQLWWENRKSRATNVTRNAVNVAMLDLSQTGAGATDGSLNVNDAVSTDTEETHSGALTAFWHKNSEVDDKLILTDENGRRGQREEDDTYNFVTIRNESNSNSESASAKEDVDYGNEVGKAPDLIEDHIKPRISEQDNGGWFSPYTETFSLNPDLSLRDESNSFDNTQLQENLLNSEEEDGQAGIGGIDNETGSLRREITRIERTKQVFGDIYWRNLRFRRHAVQQLKIQNHEWKQKSYMGIALWAAAQPFNILRILTIPTIDPVDWSKYIVMSHPPLCLLFMFFIIGFDSVPTWLIICSSIASLLLSCVLFLTTHVSVPPRAKFYKMSLLLAAFATSVAWIYSVATELVAVLSTFGVIIGANPSVIGLTVLAWGNSCGDLVGNVAIAKSGFGKMALHGCFGGPLLNILLGLGLSVFILCWRASPNPVVVGFDSVALVTGVFVLLTLVTLIIGFTTNRFRTQDRLAYALFAIYGVYLTIAIFMSTSLLVACLTFAVPIFSAAAYYFVKNKYLTAT